MFLSNILSNLLIRLINLRFFLLISSDLSIDSTNQNVAVSSVDSGQGCWWTGCQKNDWAVVGCGQYNMTDKNTRDCQDGKEYNCCPKLTNPNM